MTTQNLTLLNAMVQKMDWVEERQKIIAQNIANADTPEYRPQDLTPLNFKTMLADVGTKTSLNRAIVMAVQKQPGANTVKTADRVMKLIPELPF